jgi:uncharacterized protein (UPF0335 family)
LTFNIHPKPTATDVIIHKTSCHPPEQKQAAIRHMINRMNTYRLNEDTKNQELQIIEQIANSNGFDATIVQHINKPKQKRDNQDNKELWAKFTYIGKGIRTITKLFKDTPIRVAYKVNNTISKRLMPKPHNLNLQKRFEKSGIYSLTCPDCDMKYVGQTGVILRKRYNEHLHDFKYSIRKSSFATHLLDNNHSIGPIEKIMEVIQTEKQEDTWIQ